MLQKLSYFNIMLAVIYVFVYLKDGTLNSTLGLIMIIVFSWLALRSYQLDNYRWGICIISPACGAYITLVLLCMA